MCLIISTANTKLLTSGFGKKNYNYVGVDGFSKKNRKEKEILSQKKKEKREKSRTQLIFLVPFFFILIKGYPQPHNTMLYKRIVCITTIYIHIHIVKQYKKCLGAKFCILIELKNA